MDFAQALRLIQQNLTALGPRRLTALGLVGLTLFSAIALGSYVVARSDYQPLYIGLTAQDSSRMVAVLGELGIPFEVSTDGAKVSVPATAVARARGVLAERGLPSSADAGYELFDKIGPLGLTTFMQEVTRVRALEGEITRTLASMSGITSARVHLVFGDKATLRSVAQKPSASVVLKLTVAQDRAPVDAVRNVVAAAVPGLTLEDVRVVSSDGAVLAAGGEALRPGANRMLDLEKSFSAQLKQNLSDALAPVLGFSNFQSSIAVRLNADQSTISENIFDPNSRVERSVRVVKEAGNSKDGAGDQGVTVERNVPQGNDSASQNSAQNQKSNQRRDEITNYEISSKSVATTRDGYRVENVSVALVINRSALKNPDGSPLDDAAITTKITEIEKLAASAVGLDAQRGDRLTIMSQAFMVEDAGGAGSDANGLSVILQENSSSMITALMLVLGLLAFAWFGVKPLLRILIEPQPAFAAGAIAGPQAQAGDMEFEMATAPIVSGAMEMALGGEMQPGAVTPLLARLNELIERDPDQAVAVVRRWLNADADR